MTIEQIGIIGVLILNLFALFKDIRKTQSEIRKDSEDIEHTTHQDLMEMYRLVKQQRDDAVKEVEELKKQLEQRDLKIAKLILNGGK